MRIPTDLAVRPSPALAIIGDAIGLLFCCLAVVSAYGLLVGIWGPA